jgi:non-specific serine/threonine protein kinase
MFELVVAPSGHLRCKPLSSDSESVSSALLDDVVLAFEREGSGAGLFRLAARKSTEGLNPALAFWRDFAVRHLAALCNTPETSVIPPIETPTPAEMVQIILSVPPMTGAEYLTVQALDGAWRELDEWTRGKVEASGGLAAFLRAQAPHWHQVGRVCFHLAENKDDPEYPFAFLSTYASGLDKAGRPRYLPLSRALTEFAGTKNKNALVRLLTPVSEAAKKSAFVSHLVESGDIYHPYPLEADEAYKFLTEIPLYEEAGLLVRVPDWWRKRARVQAKVTVGNETSGLFTAKSLLDFSVDAAIGDEKLSRKELEELLAGGSGLRFVKGRWVEVDADKLKQVLDHWQAVAAQAGAGISLVEGMRLLAGANADLGQHDDEEVRAWSVVTAGNKLRELLQQMRAPERLDTVKPGQELHATLRPYQEAGLNWLWLLSEMGLGSCLADDMGLGKTIQVIALLLMQKKARRNGSPSLLIVPASLLGNWKSEIERFAPSLKCVYLHRSELAKDELEQHGENHATALAGVDAVFTTYAMVTRQEWLRAREWNLCVIDEAQAIKNPASSQTKLVKKVNARARVAMTGTPVENRLGDLWSLFDFVNPGLLGSAGVFKNFVKNLEKRETEQYLPLRNLVRPYILRRLKTDRAIIKDLPDKTEVKAYCHLTKKQAALYARNVEEMSVLLDTVTGMARRGLVLSFLMRFKQICNHPSQLSGDALFVPDDSGKYARLRELCEEIASRQEKALVFTQFREMTDPLAGFLGDVFGHEGLVLHGGTPVKERKKLVDRFQQEDGPPFFVLSLKAGGTGLNLTAASHVIHFDRWWNPAVENQATDRAFRIGQKKNVLVHKFVSKGTLEERIDALIEEKSRLAGEILEGGAESNLTEMSNAELLKLVSLDIEQAMG